MLTAEGSRYRRPSTDELPLNSFSVADNNAVAEFVGGVFDGGRYSLTWNADGSMETTSTAFTVHQLPLIIKMAGFLVIYRDSF